jgi:transposase
MGRVSTIGLDLAKNVFQAHGADASGGVVFRKKLRRGQVLAHYWGRRQVRSYRTVVIAPAYVKPFVKRQKNDAADAEAICEAVQRPTCVSWR